MTEDNDVLSGNLEAYRMALEIYLLLRSALRENLASLHGDVWESKAIPGELQSFLDQRREREGSINWRLGGTDDLLDYAGFANLGEIIIFNEGLFSQFQHITGDAQILRTRFLELDSICSRIAYGRAISERDRELLDLFHGRLLRSRPDDGHPAAASPQRPRTRPTDRTESERMPSSAAAEHDSGQQSAPAPSARSRRASGAGRSSEATPAQSAEDQTPTSTKLKAALERKDERTILAYLYQEVTTIAERLWSDGTCPKPWVWEKVRESKWYEERFRALGLRILSDFFAVIADVTSPNGEEPPNRLQIQKDLNDRHFAQTLLALRDMFRKATEG